MGMGPQCFLYLLRLFRVDDGSVEDLPGSHLYRCTLRLVQNPPLAWCTRQRDISLTNFRWGTAATCSGAVQNMAGLVACRALLGIFEAAFGAGAPYFLSLFYRRRELGFRVSLLLGMSPLANCFASTLAYGITQIRGHLEPWRYLFIIGK